MSNSATEEKRPHTPWHREPALHFIVVGALLFVLYAWLKPATAGGRLGDQRQILVAQSYVRGLEEDYRRRTGRVPNRDDLRGLVQTYVDDEVLHREALALGLDRGDPILRRRMVQKMRFLVEDLKSKPASEAELRAYLARHQDQYRLPGRRRLSQVFLSRQRRGAAVDADAQKLRARLIKERIAHTKIGTLGDGSLLPKHVPARSRRELSRTFGEAFAQAAFAAPIGRWSEPITSTYGVHLLWVDRARPGRPAKIDEVRSQITRAIEAESRETKLRRALDRLRKRYRVSIQWPTKRPAK